MRTKQTLYLLATLSLVAVLMATAVAALQAQPALASARTVTLTIDNRASSEINLSLTGPGQYFLKVAGETKKDFTVNQGQYTYTIKGCGMTAKSSLNLSQDTILINPVCGGKVRTVPKDDSKIDLSAVLKVVPVMVSSELTYKTMLIMTGPSTYVFTLTPGQDRAVTIGKGVYTVRYNACGVNIKRTFQAFKGATLYLRCP